MTLTLNPGSRVQFRADGHLGAWWTVQAADDRYVIVTSPAQQYTVIDWQRGVRGPCDGLQPGPDGYATLLDALNRPAGPDGVYARVSDRAAVPLDVTAFVR